MTLQCPLGKCQPVPIDAEAVKRDGWRAEPDGDGRLVVTISPMLVDSPQPSLI